MSDYTRKLAQEFVDNLLVEHGMPSGAYSMENGDFYECVSFAHECLFGYGMSINQTCDYLTRFGNWGNLFYSPFYHPSQYMIFDASDMPIVAAPPPMIVIEVTCD